MRTSVQEVTVSLRNDDNVVRFVEAATRLCLEIEFPKPDDAWLRRLVAALAATYASAYALPDVTLDDNAPEFPEELDVTSEEREMRVAALAAALGKHDGYWAFFDPSEPPETFDKPVLHSLSDDLADIYRDIAPGLRAWKCEREDLLPVLVFDWKHPLFASHWGVHAVSALRALHPLAHLRGISEGA